MIYIVDDDEAVRDSLAVLLETDGYEVATFASAHAFLENGWTRGGCLIVDVRMPEMDGIELLAAINRRPNPPPAIMITGHGDVPIAVRSMKLGAFDFIEKPCSPETLIASVEAALARASGASNMSTCAPEIIDCLQRLTPRERDVLEHLVVGRANKEIARELDISPRTVEIHRARVMAKMAANSLSQLVRMAVAAGIDPEA